MKLTTTKGEWKPVKRGDRLFIASSTKDEHGVLKNVVDVATVEYIRNSENGLDATEGNASLMAAAPEMYEALDAAVRALAWLVYKADGETERKESANLNIDGKSGEQIVNRIYNIFDKVKDFRFNFYSR